jgi:hypothetical protein
VTEKVWESESASEVEVEEPQRENEKSKTAPAAHKKEAPAKKSPQKKAASPVKGKQTSLMSFFKKK